VVKKNGGVRLSFIETMLIAFGLLPSKELGQLQYRVL